MDHIHNLVWALAVGPDVFHSNQCLPRVPWLAHWHGSLVRAMGCWTCALHYTSTDTFLLKDSYSLVYKKDIFVHFYPFSSSLLRSWGWEQATTCWLLWTNCSLTLMFQGLRSDLPTPYKEGKVSHSFYELRDRWEVTVVTWHPMALASVQV